MINRLLFPGVLLSFISCRLSGNPDCQKVHIEDDEYRIMSFRALPDAVRTTVLNLASKNQLDTAVSLDHDHTYSYQNPGNGKGYSAQVISNRNLHTIDGQCYEALLRERPYILYHGVIYSLAQSLPLNCSGNSCVPDTLGIDDVAVYSIDLRRITGR